MGKIKVSFRKGSTTISGMLTAAGLAGLLICFSLLNAGCRPGETAQLSAAEPSVSMLPTVETLPKIQAAPNKKSNSLKEPSPSPTSTLQPTSTPPVVPTATTAASPTAVALINTPQPTAQPTVMPTETAVPLANCSERFPGDDLLAVVTLDFGLSRDFAPDDLTPLADYLPLSVTLGYPTEVREVMLKPLVKMIEDMLAAGLQPRILSGYRSYIAQTIAWNKWNNLYPDHVSIISAPPGHSEHQLGTVVDFGSPELPGVVGQPDIEFHTYFYKTSEGQWLAENAYKYGFTLSYPLEAFEVTGFYYEPWHYRYVGEDMAQQLHEQGLSLTEYQLAENPPPCLP